MKILLLAIVTIFAFSAEASYYATHCSNARGTVKWETGHNSNTITFKYVDTEDREKAISVSDVAITSLVETTISESDTRCNFDQNRTYAAQVKIEAATESPSSLDFLGLELPLKETVICEYHVSSRGRCP
jgi:hypothetical protein